MCKFTYKFKRSFHRIACSVAYSDTVEQAVYCFFLEKFFVFVKLSQFFCLFFQLLSVIELQSKSGSQFFPYFMSSTVVAVVWCFVFFPTSSGILNNMLIHLGLENLTRVWLGDSKTALWCICAVIIWCCIGYYVVLYLSGLDSISSEIYEAATLDGASAWQQVTRITLPLMKNILGITLVLLMSGTLAVTFTYSKIMTNGGPSGSTTVLLQYIYKQGIEQGNVGYASAVTVFTMFLGISLAVLSRAMTSNRMKEQGTAHTSSVTSETSTT